MWKSVHACARKVREIFERAMFHLECGGLTPLFGCNHYSVKPLLLALRSPGARRRFCFCWGILAILGMGVVWTGKAASSRRTPNRGCESKDSPLQNRTTALVGWFVGSAELEVCESRRRMRYGYC